MLAGSERTQRAWEGANLGAPVVWFEVAGRDLDALRQFYSRLFGWRIELDPAAPMPYGLVHTGAEGGIPGGIYAPGEPAGSYVSFYVAVEDLERALARAETLGAKLAQPPTPLADGSRVAMVNDPEGHRIGLIQQATPPA
jgi:predicted enzyme related to lactoylglutathione lyase